MNKVRNDSVYLNNAAQGYPLAPGVVEAITEAMRSYPCENIRSTSESYDIVERARRATCDLLGTQNPSEIIFFHNASLALNQAIFGLDWQAGDEIITSVAEHNSIIRPLHRVEVEKNAIIKKVGIRKEGQIAIDDFSDLLSPKTKLVALTHASNVTGAIYDVKPLFELSKQHGAITLLDACQTIGKTPVHPFELSADMAAFSGHKGLHSAPGVGVLYCNSNIALTPIIVGGTGFNSQSLIQPKNMPFGFETGTKNMPVLAGYLEAVKWNLANSKRIASTKTLGKKLKEALSSIPNVDIIGKSDTAGETGTVSFIIDGWDSDDVGLILQKSYNIICRTGLHCAPLIHENYLQSKEGSIRFSASYFNTESELAYAVSAVKEVAQCT